MNIASLLKRLHYTQALALTLGFCMASTANAGVPSLELNGTLKLGQIESPADRPYPVLGEFTPSIRGSSARDQGGFSTAEFSVNEEFGAGDSFYRGPTATAKLRDFAAQRFPAYRQLRTGKPLGF